MILSAETLKVERKFSGFCCLPQLKVLFSGATCPQSDQSENGFLKTGAAI